MATITTAVNLDDASRSSNEAMTINSGGSLTIRTDTRVHANAPANMAGILGSTTINRGSLIWDSTNVRVLSFDSGTGNVPAIGTSVTQGGVTGYLLGVWANWASAPTAVGQAMPTSGYLKFRSVSGGAFAAGALTGIGASATAADRQGWIEIAHNGSSVFTIPRLGTHQVRGGRFFLDNTNGNIGQTIQTPVNGSTQCLAPGIWVETAPNSGVYEFWPSIYSLAWVWNLADLGSPLNGGDRRKNFVYATAGGVLQFGASNDMTGTYTSTMTSSNVGYSSTYLPGSPTYTWASNTVKIFCPSGHHFVTGDQAGFVFASGPTTGVYTITVKSAKHIEITCNGSGSPGSVTIRTGVTFSGTNSVYPEGEYIYLSAVSGPLASGLYKVVASGTSNNIILEYPHTDYTVAGTANLYAHITVTITSPNIQPGHGAYFDFTSGSAVDGTYYVRSVSSNTFTIRHMYNGTVSGNVTMRRQIGNVPASGCRTWIPSNILQESTSGTPAQNVIPNSTIGSRPNWVTSNAGYIDFEYLYGCSGYFSFTNAFNVKLVNSCCFDALYLNTISAPLNINNFHLSFANVTPTYAVQLMSLFSGGTIQHSKLQKAESSSYMSTCGYVSSCKDLVFTDVLFGSVAYARNIAVQALQFQYCDNIQLNDLTVMNGLLAINSTSNVDINDFVFFDRYNGYNGGQNPLANGSILVNAGSSNVTIDGMSVGDSANGIINQQPTSSLLSLGSVTNIKFRNVGSRLAPVSLGTFMMSKVDCSSYRIVSTSGNTKDVKLQRLFFDDIGAYSFISVNSDTDMSIENCSVGSVYHYGYSGRTAPTLTLSSNNQKCKGLRIGGGINTTGQAAVYGTHFSDVFLGDNYGQFTLSCNEPTTDTAGFVTVTSGTVLFNSSGGMLAQAVGSQVVVEDDCFRKGHTGFDNFALQLASGTASNFTFEYQIDIGSGYNGSWTALTGANLSAITVDPAIGFKMKWRITCAVANSDILTFLYIITTTTPSAQDNFYPLDVCGISISEMKTNSRIRVSKVSDENDVLYSGVGPSFTVEYMDPIMIEVRCASGSPAYKPWRTQVTPVSGGSLTLTALQDTD